MQAFALRIEDRIKVVIERMDNGQYLIIVEGPEDILDHGTACWVDNFPPNGLKDMPRIFAKILKGQEVHLSHWALRRTDCAEHIASLHHESIFFELSLAQCLGTGFLTEIPAHIEFLKNMSYSPPGIERDFAIEKYLTCLVPFTKELNLSEILKLRKGEEESFLIFKAALAEAVDEYRKNYDVFSEADAKAVYADVIKPKLAKLQARIQKSRRLLIKGTTRKVLAWTAAISAGLYTGFLPQGLAAAAAGLGLTKVLADFTEDLMNKSDTEDAVRDHDMYFLWKLQKKVRS